MAQQKAAGIGGSLGPLLDHDKDGAFKDRDQEEGGALELTHFVRSSPTSKGYGPDGILSGGGGESNVSLMKKLDTHSGSRPKSMNMTFRSLAKRAD